MSKISKAMDKAERENERGRFDEADGTKASGFVADHPGAESGGGDAVTARRTPPPRTAGPLTPPENSEEYHGLASEIYLALPDIRSRVIMVTSAVDGEGTSTVAREFAETLAVSNAVDTLLVDANLRKPGHHRALRMQQDPGLTDAVLGGAELSRCIQTTQVPHLSLMATGRRVVAPPRVFTDPNIDDVIGSIRRGFPLTVIDMPPVLSFSEGLQLSGRVDGVVLVIRAGRTKRQLVELATEQLRGAGANILGTVLNRRRFYIPRMIYERL